MGRPVQADPPGAAGPLARQLSTHRPVTVRVWAVNMLQHDPAGMAGHPRQNSLPGHVFLGAGANWLGGQGAGAWAGADWPSGQGAGVWFEYERVG